MTDKQIIIDVCPYQGECSVSGCKRNDDGCFVRQLFEERYRAENQIVDLNKMVEAKEQECERLNEHSVGFARKCQKLELDVCHLKDKNYNLQRQLDQLKQQLEAYKMEAEEGKEINAELKAENDELKKKVESYVCSTNCYKYKEADQLKADNKHLNGLLDQALKELEEHRDALEKVKELIQKEINDCEHCDDCESCEYNCCTRQILQICDEVNKDVSSR